MKLGIIAASVALTIVPALVVSAQHAPGLLPAPHYGAYAAPQAYGSDMHYSQSPIANCQCDNRKGYDLWCQPVSFLGALRRSGSCCCGEHRAPSCCAPEPTCTAPAPSCCAPEPVCCAPEPVCAAPAPACCAPEPTCGAPRGCGCNRCGGHGIFNGGPSPLSDLHAKLQSLFACKKCCKSSCGCDDCGCTDTGSPAYFNPTPSTPRTLPALPDSINNPFLDDPATSIPVPDTTTQAERRTRVKPAQYRR